MAALFQLELEAQAQGEVDSDFVAQAKRRVADLEEQASAHMTMTFVLTGITGAVLGLAISMPKLRAWRARSAAG